MSRSNDKGGASALPAFAPGLMPDRFSADAVASLLCSLVAAGRHKGCGKRAAKMLARAAKALEQGAQTRTPNTVVPFGVASIYEARLQRHHPEALARMRSEARELLALADLLRDTSCRVDQ